MPTLLGRMLLAGSTQVQMLANDMLTMVMVMVMVMVMLLMKL
jgi:hypothetical protein